jgi:hypothetical protein
MRLAALAPIGVLLTACGNEVLPADVRSRISDDLGNVIAKTNGAQLPGATMMQFIGLSPVMDSNTIDYLDTNVFSDANFIGSGTYRIPPELVCATGDQACVTRVAAQLPQIRVDDNNGLNFYIELDQNNDEPLVITLRHDEVTATLDLDDAQDAITALANAIGITDPQARVSGQVTADVSVATGVHVAFTLDRTLSIFVGMVGNADDMFSFATSGSVVLDPSGTTIALGATTARAPGLTLDLAPVVASIDPNNTITGTFDLQLGSTAMPAPYNATRVTLDGSLQTSDDQLAVRAGSLELTTDPDTYGFLAITGQCVTATHQTTFTQYAVESCP